LQEEEEEKGKGICEVCGVHERKNMKKTENNAQNHNPTTTKIIKKIQNTIKK